MVDPSEQTHLHLLKYAQIFFPTTYLLFITQVEVWEESIIQV